MEPLLQLMSDLGRDLPPRLRYRRVVQILKSAFQCDAIGLLKLEGEVLRPVAVEGLAEETLGRRFRLADHPRLQTILYAHEPVIFEPDTDLPDPYDGLVESRTGDLHVHDCMGVTLYVDGRAWGVLTFDALAPGRFTRLDLERLKHFVLLAEASVRLAELSSQLEALRSLRADAGTALASGLTAGRQELIGQCPAIQELKQELMLIADSDLSVLILGETGVGKELVAREIHALSRRRDRPMVHVNCAALPEGLAESELFGHVKGAFSGALSHRAGKFEAAQGGTLFLDEVGELPLAVQAKLLRAIQHGEVQRVGSDAPVRIDVRIVAATNRDLKEAVRQGKFRADLYHRLSVYPVFVPPLRERGNDVLLLAGHFLELNRSRLGVRSLRLSRDAEKALLAYGWPGNVRELEHVVSRAALKARAKAASANAIVTIERRFLDLELEASDPPPGVPGDHGQATPAPALEPGLTLHEAQARFLRRTIEEALTRHGGNWSRTAASLGVDPSNLHKLARRLGLKQSGATPGGAPRVRYN